MSEIAFPELVKMQEAFEALHEKYETAIAANVKLAHHNAALVAALRKHEPASELVMKQDGHFRPKGRREASS
jgi:hypothetical protein